jgi:predicted nucleotidyltransferase
MIEGDCGMLQRQVELCRRWAAADQGEITRVYFYGSQVWGQPRPSSDLDILIVAQPDAVMLDGKLWELLLASLLSLPAHHNTALPILVDRIKSQGLLIYSRHGNQLDWQFDDEIREVDPHDGEAYDV